MVKIVRLVAFVIALSMVATVAPAEAAPTTGWRVDEFYNDMEAGGNFAWLNQSVQVGGGLTVDSSGFCGAVVFTAYDGSDRQVARETRPMDGQYYCSPGRHGFGFTLDPAGSPRGGIQKITVDLWLYLPGSSRPRHSDTEHYRRPATGSLVAAQPAAAQDYSSFWIVRDAGTIDGTFIWHNQSVQVAGRLESGDECVAVVYSIYAGDRLLDRAARPGDGNYLCNGATTHGFGLQADVVGGATHAYIDLWRHPKGSNRYVRSAHVICYRAWTPCTDD